MDELRRLRDELARAAAQADAVGDRSAPFLRSLVLRCDIEQRRDDRVEEMLETSESIAGGAIATKAADALPAAIDRLVMRRSWVWGFAAAGVVAVALGVTGVQAYRAGNQNGRAETVHLEAAIGMALTRDDAETWRLLMLYNTIATTHRECSQQTGRLRCSFALWAGPAPPPEEQTAQNGPAVVAKPKK